jgi:LysM domain
MRSTYSTFAARVCYSTLCLVAILGSAWAEEANYSLWPRRPEALAEAARLAEQGKVSEALASLEPLMARNDVVGSEARDIAGTLRLREILDPDRCPTEKYVVKRGDSWLKIASKTKCPLDMIIHLNQLTNTGALQQGQVLKVYPLNFRVEIDVPQKQVVLYDGETFIKSYSIQSIRDNGQGNETTTVKAEQAMADDRAVTAFAPEYASADKTIILAKPGLAIDFHKPGKALRNGYYLSREDCNELSLLLRVGNEVSIVRKYEPKAPVAPATEQ